jgi:hypothetical protein
MKSGGGRWKNPISEGATTALPPTKQEIDKLLAIAGKYGIEIKL